MGDREELEQGLLIAGRRGLFTTQHDSRGAVARAVVDDEHLDVVGQMGGSGRTVACGLAAASEIAEQLIERRPDPVRLVVRRQDERQRLRGHWLEV